MWLERQRLTYGFLNPIQKETTMAKYSKATQEKVHEEMHEMKEGKLKSGSGKKVTDPKQAIAIALSEARKEGKKAPAKKSATTSEKSAPKKAANKSAAPRKVAAKKSAAPKNAVSKKSAAPKKAVTKKRASKK